MQYLKVKICVEQKGVSILLRGIVGKYMPHYLTLHQYKVLALLAQHSQWTLKDIAKSLQVSKSAASKCVKRLEKRGVINKEIYAGSREYMHIYITREGKEAINFLSSQKFM